MSCYFHFEKGKGFGNISSQKPVWGEKKGRGGDWTKFLKKFQENESWNWTECAWLLTECLCLVSNTPSTLPSPRLPPHPPTPPPSCFFKAHVIIPIIVLAILLINSNVSKIRISSRKLYSLCTVSTAARLSANRGGQQGAALCGALKNLRLRRGRLCRVLCLGMDVLLDKSLSWQSCW